MIKKLLLLLCITSQMILTAETRSGDIPLHKIKTETRTIYHLLDDLNSDFENKIKRKHVQNIKNTSNVFMFFALDLANSRLCEMVGGNQVLLSLPNKEKNDENTFPLLETNDLIDIGLITMKTIATSEETEPTPLLKKCGREAAKTYIGNKAYIICSSYAEPLCTPHVQQLATIIEKELPAEITQALHEAGYNTFAYDAIQWLGAFALKSSISLLLNTIDNHLCTNNTKGKV